MKKRSIMCVPMVLIVLMVSSGALAQQPGVSPGESKKPAEAPLPATPPMVPNKTGPGASGMMKAPRALYASTLIGASVKSPTGENLGTIDELVIDPQQAQIKTAVVSMGGVLGIGAKVVAVPWSAVQPAPDGGTVTVAHGKEELEKAPDWKKPEEGQAAARESSMSPLPTSRPGPTQ